MKLLHNVITGVAGLAMIYCSANHAAAFIGAPSYGAGSSPTDLTAVGSSDWALYGKQGGPTQTPSVSKSGGTSITMLTPVITGFCTADNSGLVRSSATFSWTGGTPTASGSGVDPYDNGFTYANAAIANYCDSYETLTFVPGDTNLHVIHLYGYLSNDNTSYHFSSRIPLPGQAP